MYSPLTPEEEAIINDSFEKPKESEHEPEKFRICPILLFSIIFAVLVILLYIGYRAIGTQKQNKVPAITDTVNVNPPWEERSLQ